MASNIISEFLVKIGFKVDDAARARLDANINRTARSLQSFAGHAGNAARQFETFGKRVAIASVAAGVTLAAFSSRLEKLFFFGQRTGVGVAQGAGLELAFQNIGIAAGQATASIERLAEELRYNPVGTQGLLNQLGVQAKDAAGNLRNAGDIYLGILEKISQKTNRYEQDAFLSLFGISRTELTQYETNKARFTRDLQQRTEQLQKLQKSLGLNAEAGNEFASGIRRLLQNLEFLGLAIVSRLTGGDGSLVKLNEWIEKNAATLVDRLIEALRYAWQVLNETIIPAFKAVVDFLTDLDTKTGGWSTKLLALAVVLNALGVTSLIGGVVSLAAALVTLGGALVGLSGVGAVAGLAVLTKVLAAAAVVGGGIYLATKAGETLNNRQKQVDANKVPQAERAQAAIDFFQSKGWSREQAIGIAANLQKESNFREGAIGDGGQAFGIAQWHPARQAEFKKRYGKDIRRATFQEQLEFVNYELTEGKEKRAGSLLRTQSTSTGSAAVVSQHYERPANTQAEIASRSQIAQNLEKTTTNNFNIVMHVADGQGAAAAITQLADSTARTMVSAR